MFINKQIKFTARLILVASMLWSCSSVEYSECPTYPIGGKEVGVELEKVPYQGFEHFWEWVARLNKLRQTLALCKKGFTSFPKNKFQTPLQVPERD